MKILTCSITPGTNQLAKILKAILQDFGHKVQTGSADYTFICNDLGAAAVNQPSKIVYLDNPDGQLNIYYLASEQKVYLIKQHSINDEDNLTECLEDLIIQLARVELEDILNDSMLRENLQLCASSTKPGESKQLVSSTDKILGFSRGDTLVVPPHNLVQLFLSQVQQNPEHMAVVCEDVSYTYQELDNFSSRLAQHILISYKKNHAQELQTGTPIAFYFERKAEVMVAIFAILKLRCAYVPIDIKISPDRLHLILEDTKSPILIAGDDKVNELILSNVNVNVIVCKSAVSLPKATLNLTTEFDNNIPAYILYTSGSTGKPKGCIITHANLVNLFYSTQKRYGFSDKDNIAQYCAFAFDVFCWDWSAALLSGSTFHIIPENVKQDSKALIEFLNKYKITAINLPTAVFHVMDEEDFANLPYMINMKFGGEKLCYINANADKIPFNLYNGYGPTETTVECMQYKITDINQKDFPIGQPIDNVQVYILNNELNLVQEGTIGEIYISGAGVGVGYLNNDQLTQEQFLPNKFATPDDIEHGYTKLYKTGDLAKWLPDGNLEYIGRNDFQVKFRGFRIELGDIEAAMLGHKEVKQSVVLLDKKVADGALVGYYLSENGNDIIDLKVYLNKVLPEYMVPTFFIHMDSFPLTLNGKVDRNKLLELNIVADAEEYVAPVGEIEIYLAEIWKRFLKLDRISRSSSFFALGGHSVLVMRLLSEIRSQYSCNLVPRNVFANPKLYELASIIANNKSTSKQINIVKTNLTKAKASPVQINYWMINQMGNSASTAFTTPVFFNIHKDIEANLLSRAVKQLVARHPMLRSKFSMIDDVLYQVVTEDKIDLILADGNEESLSKWLQEQNNIVFDLSYEQLFRPGLFKVTNKDYSVLSLTHHHAIGDGYSIDILLRDLLMLYSAEKGETVSLPEIKYSYIDFTLWHENWLLNSKLYIQHMEYWQAHLPTNPNFTLPSDKTRPTTLTYDGAVFSFELSEGLTQKIGNYAKEQKITEFALLLSAFSILLAKYSGENRVNVGIPFANRHYHGVENIVGCFINTLPFEYEINPNLNTLDIIKDISSGLSELQSYQNVYYPEIIEQLKVQTNFSYAPLFQVMFVSELFEETNNVLMDGIIRNNYAYNTAKLDFSCYFLIIEGKLVFNFEYNINLFTSKAMSGLADYFKNVLHQIADDVQVRDISLLGNSADILALSRGNDVKVTKKTLLQLFSEQVDINPNQTALVGGDTIHSYRELDHYSTRLAELIVNKYYAGDSQKLAPETMIAFCFERTPEVIHTILAILKLGCAYVPIDSKTGIERLNYILSDSKAPLLITNISKLLDFNLATEVVFIDDIENIIVQGKHPALSSVTCTPETIAYILYTSGTTGKPKGCAVSHANLINLFYYSEKTYALSSDDKIAQYCSFAFDTFCSDWSAALLSGATLYIVPEEIRGDSKLLVNFLNQNQITFMDIPTAVFHVFDNEDLSNLTTIQNIKIGGEKLRYINTNKLAFNLYNAYGPTETTVESIVYKVIDSTQSDIPIGRPLDNVQAYVMDNALNLVPQGVVGELYIGGAGVSKGYINKPELTQKQFINNKFATEEDHHNSFTRLYKTGDLVKWSENGNLEYIGRNDFQVKLRGYRIELGEIETAIQSHPEVKQSVVLLDKNIGDGALVAYYTGDADGTKLKDYLVKKLPEYMLPAFLIQTATIPLTLNGKTDRSKLLELNSTLVNTDDEFSQPLGEIEDGLANIWKKLLKQEQISRDKGFFELGGHSVLLMRLLSEIRNKYRCNLIPKDVFNSPVLSELARLIEKKSARQQGDVAHFDKMHQITKTNYFKAKAATMQHGLYLIHQYDQNAAKSYTTPVFLDINLELNVTILNNAIKRLVVRHEMLRCRFIMEMDNLYQVIDSDGEVTLDIIYGKRSELKSWLDEQASFVFDLSSGKLFKPCLFIIKNSPTPYSVLSLTHHHIIADGTSIDIMLRDLFRLYRHENDKGEDLPVVKYSYIDFCTWFNEWQQHSKIYANHLDYWQKHLPQNPCFSLPSDKLRSAYLTYDGFTFAFDLDPQLCQTIREFTKQNQFSEFEFLLSAFYVSLAIYSGEKRVNVGIPFANRHYNGVEDVVACFINTLPFEYEIDVNLTTIDLIRDIRDKLFELQTHQGIDTLTLVENAHETISSGFNQLYQILFSMQPKLALNFNDLQLSITGREYFNHTSKYDLTVNIQSYIDKYTLIVEYNTNLFTKNSIIELLKTYTTLLTQFSQDNLEKKQYLKYLNYLDLATYQKVIHDWNQTEKNFPEEQTIHGMFEEQAARTPDSVALVYENIRLSYRELNQRANQLAHLLRDAYHLKGDDLVVVFIDRSEYMLIGILAILKAGAAYVPVDSSYPDERIQYILDDSKPRIILANEKYKTQLERLAKSAGAEINLQFLDSHEVRDYLSKKSESNLICNITSENLAYVIYTSGTTGKPKGVMLQHQGIVNRITWMNDSYQLSATDKVLQKTPYVFDVSVWELFWANWYGACIVFAKPDGHKDANYLINLMNREKITLTHFVPSMLNAFEDTLEILLEQGRIKGENPIPSLKYIFCSGEALSLASVQKCHKLLPKTALHNLYGPTEASVDVLYYDCSNREITAVYIGKPIHNTSCYVLDDLHQPLPVGGVGELYLGGAGLARGYLNLPELTAERFIENPFQSEEEKLFGKNARIYKTGDLVRYLPGGDLEYIGRNDFQIKLRGYRIELGEIEAAIDEYTGIIQSVVVFDKRIGDGVLIAYYATHDSGSQDEYSKKLKEFLTSRLPGYMKPTFLIKLEEIPLTINGKVDRKQLAKYHVDFRQLQQYIQPSSSIESSLLELFRGIINIDSIGIGDNFFDIGGNSIQAAKLISLINGRFNKNFMISMLYKNPTVQQLTCNMGLEYTALIKLNKPHNCDKKLFMFHTARGSAEVYFEFAKLFDDIELIGVESYNLYNDNVIEDLTDLTNLYSRNIINAYPNLDLYYLSGWSFGGLLAYDVAQHLTNHHGKKCVVCLFDTLNSSMFASYIQIDKKHAYNTDKNYGVNDKYIDKSRLIGSLSDSMALGYQSTNSNYPVYLIKGCNLLKIKNQQVKHLIQSAKHNCWESHAMQLHTINFDTDHESMFDTENLDSLYKIVKGIFYEI